MKIPEGFTPWTGGGDPFFTKVEVIFADGERDTDYSCAYSWSHDDGYGDIIAYRVIEPPIDHAVPATDHAAALAEALEAIQFLATNHGGWDDSKILSDIHDKASKPLVNYRESVK